MRVASVSSIQCVACFVVAAAGLVPVVQQNRPFWGLYCISFDEGPPRVQEVDSDSPAEFAHLRSDDVILSANGADANFSNLMALLDGLKQGETALLRVKRGETELDISATGLKPPIAVIYYPTVLHPVAGVVALALGLVIFATQPLKPTPRWRVILLGVTGLALAVFFFLAITQDNVFAYWQLRRYHNLNWGAKWHFEQNWVGLAASILLASLAAWEFRGLLQRSATAKDELPNPPLEQPGPV